jgi:hypothetical protein
MIGENNVAVRDVKYDAAKQVVPVDMPLSGHTSLHNHPLLVAV